MMMFAYVPMSLGVVIADSWPVVGLKSAHAGCPSMLKLSVSPSGSLAVGRNRYSSPATTDVAGAPDITGGLFEGEGEELLPPEQLVRSSEAAKGQKERTRLLIVGYRQAREGAV